MWFHCRALVKYVPGHEPPPPPTLPLLVGRGRWLGCGLSWFRVGGLV